MLVLTVLYKTCFNIDQLFIKRNYFFFLIKLIGKIRNGEIKRMINHTSNVQLINNQVLKLEIFEQS